MSTPLQHAIYGLPPASLATISAGATQYSPLIPGSAALEDVADGTLQSALLYAPPSTLERRYVLAQLLRCLAPDGSLLALAANDKGGTRLAKELEALGCAVVSDSKQHHRICRTPRPALLRGIDDALQEGAPHYLDTLGLWTQPGLFSWDRPDTGTTLLLQHLPRFSGVGADIGCGLGVLSRAVLQSESVTAVTLIDIDRRALHVAQQNLSDARCSYLWADARAAALPPTSCDFIVMNPPFHDTGVEDHSLGQQLIARAAEALKPTGALWLVANRHLPYEALLAARFAGITPIATENGFKVIAAEKHHG